MDAGLVDCTGGARNAVVESHPSLCHHCGFVGDRDLQVCTACHIQAHDDCLRFREDGRCDACYHALGDEDDAVCVLCRKRDPACSSPHATDRLTKYVVYFGRTWSPGEVGDEGVDVTGSLVSTLLSEDPSRTFRPSQLPEDGQRRMTVTLEDGTVLRSDPFVVHTWCLNALFQMVTPHVPLRTGEVEDYWHALLEELDAPTRQAFGVPGGATCTFETHPCLVCRETTGYLTFCVHHLSHGCQRCRMRGEARRTVKAFHPSCAVWAGMQRLVRPAAPDGMLCDGQRHMAAHLCQAVAPRETALVLSQRLPGLNLHLLHRLHPRAVCTSLAARPRKGRRYGTWETSVRRKPVKRTWEDADVYVERFETLLRTMLRDEDEGRRMAESVYPPVLGLFATRALAVLRQLQEGSGSREEDVLFL